MALLRSISSLGDPGISLEGLCSLAGRHGLDAVEVRVLENELRLPRYFTHYFGSPAAFGEACAKLVVPIVCLDSSFCLCGAKDEDRSELLEFIPWAEAAGIRMIRVFDGGSEGSGAELEEAERNWRWWDDLRTRRHWRVDLAIETHSSLLTSARIMALLARVPAARLLWDSHHTWKIGGEAPALTWSRIGKHVVHIHVKDSISRAGPTLPYSYVLPGSGEYPMAKTLAALKDSYTGCISLEWELLWHRELPDLETALQSARDHHWW